MDCIVRPRWRVPSRSSMIGGWRCSRLGSAAVRRRSRRSRASGRGPHRLLWVRARVASCGGAVPHRVSLAVARGDRGRVPGRRRRGTASCRSSTSPRSTGCRAIPEPATSSSRSGRAARHGCHATGHRQSDLPTWSSRSGSLDRGGRPDLFRKCSPSRLDRLDRGARHRLPRLGPIAADAGQRIRRRPRAQRPRQAAGPTGARRAARSGRRSGCPPRARPPPRDPRDGEAVRPALASPPGRCCRPETSPPTTCASTAPVA